MTVTTTVLVAFGINALMAFFKSGFASKWSTDAKQGLVFGIALVYALAYLAFTSNITVAHVLTVAGSVLTTAITAYEVLWKKFA